MMATRYFVDPQGNYLGGFDGAPPPTGAIEVSDPPPDARWYVRNFALDRWEEYRAGRDE